MRLEDCMDAIIDYRGKTPRKTTSGIPLVTAKIIKAGRIDAPSEFISEDEYDRWMTRGLPLPGDVVITTEAPLGEVAQLGSERIALAQRVILLRGRRDLLNNSYLKYLLQSTPVQNQLTARASGTTVSGIRQSELREVVLDIPALAEQEAIAATLSALDDKIELNSKISATLEAMARALFKSWFVDFDPVRAKSEGRDSGVPPQVGALFPSAFEKFEQEEVPHGWRIGTLGEVAVNERRGISHNDIIEGTPYIGLEHMPRRNIALDRWGHASALGSNKSQFRQGDILFGKLRPYFHKVGVAPISGVCSTDILVISARSSEWLPFVLMHVSSDALVAHTDRCSTGTKMPRASWHHIASYQIALPPEKLAAQFSQIIRPMIQWIIGATHESRTLAALRDALLPKLISGELRLTDDKRIAEKSA
jgi:type I restriction enzyme, S subunit